MEKVTSTKLKSPAKRKQPEAGSQKEPKSPHNTKEVLEGTSTIRTRSKERQLMGRQDVAPSPTKSPRKSEQVLATKQKSLAKQKQPHAGSEKVHRSPHKTKETLGGTSTDRKIPTEWKMTREQADAIRLSKSPSKPEQVCKGCDYIGKSLRSHINKSPKCKVFHDMVELENQAKKRHLEMMAARNRERYQNDPVYSLRKRAASKEKNEDPEVREKKRAASKEKYKDPEVREKKKAASKEKYKDPEVRELKKAASIEKYKDPEVKAKTRKAASKRYYQKHKERILNRMALQRKAKFENKTALDRHMDFKNSMKDVCAYPCICCHTILSSTKDCRVKGGLKSLEKELGDLFKMCIFDEDEDDVLPKELTNGKDIYLCNTCSRWLRQYQEMPPKCHKNGLGVDPIPPGLQELDDLGMLLISKSILFIKLYNMAVSRWYKSKDHAVHVPIDDETLLKTYQKATSFPRLPEEAGVVAIDFKRKHEYKNSHEQFYIQPKLLMQGLEELINGHPSYKNIKINERYPTSFEESPEVDISEMEEEDEEDDNMDSVMRNQLNHGGPTMMVNANLKTDIVTNLPREGDNTKEQRVVVAPGEGKLPTSLTRDKNWDIDSLPKHFPRGRFGLHHPRKLSQRKNLTVQDFVCQRFQNIDPRWRNSPTALFSYLYCVERLGLEKAMSIAYRRGKVGKDGKLTNLENASTIFKNQPGTDQYWQTKRYEVMAKMEQLGPFQIFFTLSCADKRWDENFVAILQQRGLTIHYRPAKEQPINGGKFSYQSDDIFVEENGVLKPLRDYLNENVKLHDMVKENILTITMMFDKRVKEFINKIVMAQSNPMRVKYYHYRVEFQKRGAGHIHGVLWLDLELLENTFKGLTSAMKKFKTQETLTKKEKDVVASFVDSCSTCSLKDKDLYDTITIFIEILPLSKFLDGENV